VRPRALQVAHGRLVTKAPSWYSLNHGDPVRAFGEGFDLIRPRSMVTTPIIGGPIFYDGYASIFVAGNAELEGGVRGGCDGVTFLNSGGQAIQEHRTSQELAPPGAGRMQATL
jgi:hypothetical protein